MDPITILGVFGSAASIASYLSSFRTRDDGRKLRSVGADQVAKAAGSLKRQIKLEYLQILQSEEGLELINSLTVISPQILRTLQSQLEDAESEYAKCLEDAANESESHACDRTYEAKICDILNRIRRRNGDSLPRSKFMENLWTSYRCQTY